ncbi:unnamed protein product [Merluccius merluccius]
MIDYMLVYNGDVVYLTINLLPASPQPACLTPICLPHPGLPASPRSACLTPVCLPHPGLPASPQALWLDSGWNGMSQKQDRPTFYRQELNKTIWEVPDRYQHLSPVGSGAYGSVCLCPPCRADGTWRCSFGSGLTYEEVVSFEPPPYDGDEMES